MTGSHLQVRAVLTLKKLLSILIPISNMKTESYYSERRQLHILLLIIFISFIGTSVAYPIFPPLFLNPNKNFPELFYASGITRKIELGIALAVYPLGQFFGSPILGGCSDRYGRKILLIISLIGSTLGYGLTGLALSFGNLKLLLFSRFITGLMEGNLPIARAMATDLKNLNKLRSLSVINSVAAIGYIMGPILGGLLADPSFFSWGFMALPFWIAMIFSIVAMVFVFYGLKEKLQEKNLEVSIWQRFHLWTRFKTLLNNNTALKQIILSSTIFTFSTDIFYEFGPIYLTQLFEMTPIKIALYNGILCLGLSLGSGWLCVFVSKIMPIQKSTFFAMGKTAFIFLLLVIFQNPILAMLLFFSIGMLIAFIGTNISMQVTDFAPAQSQGEAMGVQYSLRMLGDAFICILGGFLIISSAILPMLISALIVVVAMMIYRRLIKII